MGEVTRVYERRERTGQTWMDVGRPLFGLVSKVLDLGVLRFSYWSMGW